jgi:hypothetical protein
MLSEVPVCTEYLLGAEPTAGGGSVVVSAAVVGTAVVSAAVVSAAVVSAAVVSAAVVGAAVGAESAERRSFVIGVRAAVDRVSSVGWMA